MFFSSPMASEGSTLWTLFHRQWSRGTQSCSGNWRCSWQLQAPFPPSGGRQGLCSLCTWHNLLNSVMREALHQLGKVGDLFSKCFICCTIYCSPKVFKEIKPIAGHTCSCSRNCCCWGTVAQFLLLLSLKTWHFSHSGCCYRIRPLSSARRKEVRSVTGAHPGALPVPQLQPGSLSVPIVLPQGRT